MGVERNSNGVITNAEKLTVREVVHSRVLCPGCHDKVFELWPCGWDAHSAFKCSGVKSGSEEQRKTEFKRRFVHLFR
jgi:hypothetical protein